MKKFVSMLLVLCMVSSCVGVVFAAEASENTAVLEGDCADWEAEYARHEAERLEREKEHAEIEAEHEAERLEREKEHAEIEARHREMMGSFAPAESEKSDSVSLMSSDYSEVVYIKTAEDLMSIDNHDGGYYELQNDIDISGIEWTPLTLTNATFNGNGYTIKGLTFTKEPEYKNTTFETYWTEECATAGLFAWYDTYAYDNKGIYVQDLNLAEINISFTKKQSKALYASGLGCCYADNCTVQGEIDITITGGGYTQVFALSSATACESNVNINVTNEGGENCYVDGLYNCYDSVHNGDISVVTTNDDDGWVHGIYRSDNCVIEGDITSDGGGYVEGIYRSDNCVIEGDITGNGDVGVYGIDDSDNCVIEGDITSDGRVYGIYGSTSCVIEGNITGNGYACGIYGGDNCRIEGDITGNGGACGIYGGDNCRIEGDITGNGGACGISNSDNCSIEGDITGNGDGYVHGIYDNCTGCVIEGDITSDGDGRVYGIDYNCTGCSIEGNITSNGDGRVYGIYDNCTGCRIEGNITSNGDGWVEGIFYHCTGCRIEGNITSNGDGWVEGIFYHCTDCRIEGNITSNGGGHVYGIYYYCTGCRIEGNITSNGNACGIYYGTGCYISGTVTESPSGYSTLTVSASTPYKGEYECDWCSSRGVFTSYPGVHCYRYIYSYDSVYPYENYYSCVNDLYYDDGSSGAGGSGGGSGGDATEPEEEGTEEEEEPEKESYIVRVIDEKSEKPYEGAHVTINGREYVTGSDGCFCVEDNGGRGSNIKIEFAGKIIYTSTNFKPAANTVNTIAVKAFELDSEDIDMGEGGSTSLTGATLEVDGKEINLIDVPLSFEFSDFFNVVKTAYNADTKQFEVLLGTDKELEGVKEDADSDSWKKNLENYKEFYDRLKTGDITEGYANYVNSRSSGSKGKLGIDGKVLVQGFMYVSLDDETMGDITGGITIMLCGNVEKSGPIPSMPLAYFVCGISGEIGSTLQWKLEKASVIDPEMKVMGIIKAALSPTVGLGVGLRDLLSLEVGFNGKIAAETHYPFISTEESFKANLSASFYAVYTLLGFKHRQSQTLVNTQIYPKVSTSALMSLNEDTKMEIVERDYLDNISLFALDTDTFKTNIYPYSNVKLVQLSDSRIMMVWTDDDTARGIMNKTALYYSILENGKWSSPKQIENDGTADYDFYVVSYEDKAAIVWQDASVLFTEKDSVESVAKKVELSYATFDGENWSSAVCITNGNDSYEYSPRVAYNGSTGYVAWTQNAEDSPRIGIDTTKEAVYKVSITGDSVSEREAVYEDLTLVYQTAIAVGGYVACIADKDGDITNSEGVLYVNKNINYDRDSTLSGLHYSDGYFYFTEGGSVKKVSASGSKAASVYSGGGDRVTILKNAATGMMAAVYEVDNSFMSNLYASYYTNGSWSSPVTVTQFSEKIRSWDAILDDNGDIFVSAVLAEVSVNDSGEFDESVRLVYSKTEPVEDICVNYMYSESDFVQGKTATVVVNVSNNTMNTLSNVNVVVEGEKSGILYEGAKSAKIKSGESGDVRVVFSVPDDFTAQNITVTVVSDNATEADGENNSITESFGGSNISVELKGSSILSKGTAKAVVKNTGSDDATNVVLTVTDEDGKTIYSKNIGTLKAGEKVTEQFVIDEEYCTFADKYDSNRIKAAVSCAEDETAQYDNESSYSIRPQAVEKIIPAEPVVVLTPGESTNAKITLYPEVDEEVVIYKTSSDTSVVAVDENGKITAQGYGTATVTCMTADNVSAKINVYVRDMGEVEITEAVFEMYGDEDNIYGEIYVSLDTTSALCEGEKAEAMVVVYDEDGNFRRVSACEVGYSSYESAYVWVNGYMPAKVKVMIWNSTEGMKPTAHVSEADLEVYD